MYEIASAAATFEMQFVINESSAYSLNFDYDASHGHGFEPWSEPQLSLSSLTDGTLLDVAIIRDGFGSWTFAGTGLLTPDTYKLGVHFSVGAGGDPLGDFENAMYLSLLSRKMAPPSFC